MKYENYDSDEEDLEFGRDSSHPLSYKEGVISEILPGKLYLSDMIAANNLRRLKEVGIQAIIALGSWTEQMSYIFHKDDGYAIDYYHIWIDDTSGEPISDYFEEAAKFINDAYGPVLVHCWMGISRSVSIVIAYLIKKKGMTYREALHYVQDRRSFICPNPGFLEQLEAYANSLQVQNQISED